MTLDLLIHSIVRQTTILVARLATSRGGRAPLAQVADQVFLDLVRELEGQGISRRVGADMFGLGLRTYQRRIQRLTESRTNRGTSLWEAVLAHITNEKLVTRAGVFLRFSHDDESQIRSVLHDLCESRLVFSSGSGDSTILRVTSDEELKSLDQEQSQSGLDEFIWALVYRLGPIGLEDLQKDTGFCSDDFEASLNRLVDSGRIHQSVVDDRTTYHSSELVIRQGTSVGWEAAVFDHFKAMVNSITARLEPKKQPDAHPNSSGGCTYTLEVWEGHPLKEEVYGTLSRLREQLSEQRSRVEEYNRNHGIPEDHTRVVHYAGQFMIAEGDPPSTK